MFDHVTKNMPPGVLAASDSPMLFALCRWWSLWRKMDRKASSEKATAKDAHMAVCAWKQCSQLMDRFGLNPVARTKLKVPSNGNVKVDDPFEELARRRLERRS